MSSMRDVFGLPKLPQTKTPMVKTGIAALMSGGDPETMSTVTPRRQSAMDSIMNPTAAGSFMSTPRKGRSSVAAMVAASPPCSIKVSKATSENEIASKKEYEMILEANKRLENELKFQKTVELQQQNQASKLSSQITALNAEIAKLKDSKQETEGRFLKMEADLTEADRLAMFYKSLATKAQLKESSISEEMGRIQTEMTSVAAERDAAVEREKLLGEKLSKEVADAKTATVKSDQTSSAMSKAAGAAYSEASSAADQAKAAMECVANSETKIKDTKKELVKAEKARVRRSMAYHEIEKLRIEAQQETSEATSDSKTKEELSTKTITSLEAENEKLRQALNISEQRAKDAADARVAAEQASILATEELARESVARKLSEDECDKALSAAAGDRAIATLLSKRVEIQDKEISAVHSSAKEAFFAQRRADEALDAEQTAGAAKAKELSKLREAAEQAAYLAAVKAEEVMEELGKTVEERNSAMTAADTNANVARQIQSELETERQNVEMTESVLLQEHRKRKAAEAGLEQVNETLRSVAAKADEEVRLNDEKLARFKKHHN